MTRRMLLTLALLPFLAATFASVSIAQCAH